jgi:DNA-binding transcriptional regulator YiaG
VVTQNVPGTGATVPCSPCATLRNWEQGRARPDAPTRVLLAVIAKHPEAVEDVVRKAN